MGDFIKKLNEYGIPLPLLRINGAATLTGTMVVITFIIAVGGEFVKLSKVLGEIDLTQANYLFLICIGNYAHKKMLLNGKDKTVTVEKGNDDNG